jgi:hypothetical protein
VKAGCSVGRAWIYTSLRLDVSIVHDVALGHDELTSSPAERLGGSYVPERWDLRGAYGDWSVRAIENDFAGQAHTWDA